MVDYNSSTTYLVAAIVVVVCVGIGYQYKEKYQNTQEKKEEFTSAGWTLVRPPNWWMPQNYQTKQWLTPYYPDQLSQPACMNKNRGSAADLNYNSSSYRHWRF